MPARFPRVVDLWLVVVALSVGSFADGVCQDGICFVDRGATGEIVLGSQLRGYLGVIDYDSDGYMDLLVGDNWTKPNRLFHNVPDVLHPGRRTLVDVTVGSGLDDADGTARFAGAVLAADYDNDGFQDVFMTGQDVNGTTSGLLYHNNGNGTFTNVTVAAGVRLNNGAEAASWSDFDLDGRLDLLVAGPAPNLLHLFHNNGNGTFTDVSTILPALNATSRPYAATWMDFDRDGYPDVFVLSRDGAGTEILLHDVSDGHGGRTFVNVAQPLGFTLHGPSPMGIAFGDFDGDGDLDIAISDAVVGTYYRNTGAHFQAFSPFATMFGWGITWVDTDNDGWLDLFTAGSYGNPNFDDLRHNLGDGTFDDISPVLNGVSDITRNAVQVDFNNDGWPDIVAVVPFRFVSVYENVSTVAHNWITLKLQGDGHLVNRDAVGAIVRVSTGGRTQVREVMDGTSTAATEDLRAHFGLGSATVVDQVEVVWPRRGNLASRTEVYPGPIAVNQIYAFTPQIVPGDANCDGAINNQDIDAFVTALLAPGSYPAAYPGCELTVSDLNGDGAVNNQDIDPFVARLFGR